MSSTHSGKRRRPQEIHLPDGKKVIATLPEDVDSLRRKYANQKEVEVEVVVHGSDEHHEFLQQSRDHHESRREKLRELHGRAFEEWEHIHTHLHAVHDELDRIRHKASDLGASFSKFGYSSNLRTYNDDSPGPSSSRASLSGDTIASVSDKDDHEQARPGATTKLFKRPVVKQWFHRGLLWRASEQTEIMAIELFFDLVYVAIIHVNGEHLAEEPDGRELLRFVVTFIMSWKIWSDITQTLSWFETDDIFTRFEILFEISCLLGLTTNMTHSFYEDEKHTTYSQMVAFYLAARLKTAIHYLVTGYLLPMIKGVMIAQSVSILIPSALWIASIYVDMPARLGLVFTALAIDTYGQAFLIGLYTFERTRHKDTWIGKLLQRAFEFYPAMNIEHKVERTNAFVSLVLGYSVVGIIFQSNGGYSFNAFLGKAILGLVQAFLFNWIYFDIDGNNISVHAIRRSTNTALLWMFAHLPFVMGYIVASAGLSKLVLATDVPNTNPEQLAESYRVTAEDHIQTGIRFFYCQGLAIALLSMTAISLAHDHLNPPTLRWGKSYRLANRIAVSIIMLLLPLADSLRSLDLISITLGLTAWVVLLEFWGKSCTQDPFIGEKSGTCVRYLAKCSKRDLASVGINEIPKMPNLEVTEMDGREKMPVHLTV